jgi:Flp pilus assembly protein TadG
MMAWVCALLKQLQCLRADERGNTAVIFAIASLPLVGAVGAAVDYSHANSIRTQMQAAVDATALMLSKDASSLSSSQLQQKASDYFNAMFTRTEAKNVKVTPSFSSADGSTLVVSAEASMDTNFMGIMGVPNMPIGAASTVKWGNVRLSVALVLDTTGSMASDGKIDALKTATKNLLDQLKRAATTNGDVLVSIIPFSNTINVGSSNYGATWIDWTDWEAEPAIMSTWLANSSNLTTWEQTGPGHSCPFTSSSHGFRCAPNPTSTSTTNTVPSSGTYSGYICPSTDSGSKNSVLIGKMYNGCYNSVASTRTIATGSSASCGTAVNCTCSGSGSGKKCTQSYYAHNWVKNARSTWNGCVTDRGTSNDFDRKVTAPSTSIPATLFGAYQNSYCSPQVMSLNYDWASMKSLVDGLYPNGATNQPIGLVHGWQSLVGGGPYPTPPAKDPKYTYQEVIVLMSDGLNTLDRWYGNGMSTNTSVDKRMVDTDGTGTCANVKAAGITIYTVHVNTDGDPMSTLLQNCASGPDKFWMVTSGSGLGQVFNQIGTALSQLRVAK